MSNKNSSLMILVETALLTAITMLCTLILKVPVGPDCYIHLGDTIMFLAVIILPLPYACFAGPVGAMLADLIGGYAFWAPWTFVIKLLCVLALGLLRKKSTENSKRLLTVPVPEFIGYVIACIFGVMGYFVAEYLLFGNWVAAATCIPLNCLQMGVGAVLSVVVYKRLPKNFFK